MKKLIITLTFSFLLFSSGCGTIDAIFGIRNSVPENTVSQTIDAATSIPEHLSILSGIGGISILGGIVLLVVSAGRKGWWPIIGGIGLVFINTLLQEYFHFIALPIIVASGVVSSLWAIKALGQARVVKLKKGLKNVSNNQ